MSNLALPTGEDYPEAAVRHFEDATALLREGRNDNAGYLAGYVIECAMKTVIQIEQGGALWAHDLEQLSRRAQELAALPGAKTARCASARTPGHGIYDYEGAGWSESRRYRPSGDLAPNEAVDWLAEAEKVLNDVVFTLRLDGVVS